MVMRHAAWLAGGKWALACAIVLGGCATTVPPAPAAPVPPVAQTAFADADTVRTTEVARGVTHTYAHEAEGPWAIHVVEIDPRECSAVIGSRKPGPHLGARATTSHLGRDAIAAINADFFMLPGGTPVGAQVIDGVTIAGPHRQRSVFAVTASGPEIGPAVVDGYVRVRGDTAAVITQVNRPSTRAYRTTHGLTLYTSFFGDSVPGDSAALRVTLREIAGTMAEGSGVVLRSDSAAGSAPIGGGEAVLFARGDAREWLARRGAGDTLRWAVRTLVGGDAPALDVVGGHPELLRGGRDVLGEQPVGQGFSETQHPRTAIGWDADGRLFFVVVDGRREGYSAGMSLPEMVGLFQRLGATDAINLDGGGSSALVVHGNVVNRPSDSGGERAVGNALILERCRD